MPRAAANPTDTTPGQLRVDPNADDDEEEANAAEQDARVLENSRRAARFSVSAVVRSEPKYIVTIAESEDKNAVNPVPIVNGDYPVMIRRGRAVVVPESVIHVLNDARGARFDDERKVWIPTLSYPFQSTPYNGDLPIGTEVDAMGKKVDPNAPQH